MNLEVNKMILEHARNILAEIKIKKSKAYEEWLYGEDLTNEKVKELDDHIDYLHATEKFWTKLKENLEKNLINLNEIEKKAK